MATTGTSPEATWLDRRLHRRLSRGVSRAAVAVGAAGPGGQCAAHGEAFTGGQGPPLAPPHGLQFLPGLLDLTVKAERVGDLPTELVQDFFEGFANAARANVHVKVMYGRSSHHQIEAVFKAFARALRVACAKDKRLAKMLPSTKGLL